MRAGKRLFENPWQPPDPALGPGPMRGLGPRYNAFSCAGCHFRDGRGAPPADVMAPPEPPPQIVRLQRIDGELDPRYGAQLNDRGVGVPGEGVVTIDTLTSLHTEDGREHRLRFPRARLSEPALGPLHPETRLHLRIPPTLVGMGLLEAVPVETLESFADPDDRDGDGISGRARRLADGSVGRFGWTTAQPDLEAQVAGAFLEDLGVTSDLRPVANCPTHDEACRRVAGEAIELSETNLERIVLYTRLLAPPARRDWDQPQTLQGRELFMDIGCAGCHIPSLRTAKRSANRKILPELSNQTIRPFTDLLLHNMGPELATDAREPGVEPGEWRTAPLWGLGLLKRVNAHLYLLHDGRARSIEDAILWHGGEASRSRDRFVELSSRDQAALLRFLESL